VSQWCAPLGASGLLTSAPAAFQQGIATSGAVFGTGPCAVATLPVVRHRTAAAISAANAGVPAGALASVGVPASALGATRQANNPTRNQMHTEKQYVTSVNADGVGAAGPPRRLEPAE
jgi:hypothetical protein